MNTPEKKYYYLYKITNKLNGKIYIGIHGTNNLDDNYMGSGGPLGKAKKKYGLENFKLEILEFFKTYKEMCLAEAAIVTKDFIKRKDNYNAIPGGQLPYYGKRSGSTKYSEGQKLRWSNVSKEEKSHAQSIRGSKKHWTPEKKNEWRENISKANTGNPNRRKGSKQAWKTMSTDTKTRRAEKIKQAKLLEYSTYSKEERLGLTLKATEAAKRKIECEYCGMRVSTGNYARWHGAKCKKRKIL